MSYYKDELKQVKIDPRYGAQIQIRSEGTTTKWMSLNRDSIPELIKWFEDNYLKLTQNDTTRIERRD